jgi:hypothetical protein
MLQQPGRLHRVEANHLPFAACFSFFLSCFSLVESLGLLFLPGFSCPLAMRPPPPPLRRNGRTIANAVSKAHSLNQLETDKCARDDPARPCSLNAQPSFLLACFRCVMLLRLVWPRGVWLVHPRHERRWPSNLQFRGIISQCSCTDFSVSCRGSR